MKRIAIASKPIPASKWKDETGPELPNQIYGGYITIESNGHTLKIHVENTVQPDRSKHQWVGFIDGKEVLRVPIGPRPVATKAQMALDLQELAAKMK